MKQTMTFLVGLKERRSYQSQVKAAQYLKQQLQQWKGLQLKEHSYTYKGQNYVNLEATLPGSDKADEILMIGAHFDSNSNDPVLAPGADDNASGTAAVLELARILSGCKPRRSIRFLFFSNEEKGTIGSKAYVKSLSGVLPVNKMVGFINVDMIAYGPNNEDLDIATRPEHKVFANQVVGAIKKWTTLPVNLQINKYCA